MHRSLAALLVLLPACYAYQPPLPAEPRDATSVDASMGATWDAVIDLFATRNIPIRTIERASGIIAADFLSVDSANGLKWADCGSVGYRPIAPNTAIPNVLVRGDSTSSTVRTSVRWSRRSFKDGDLECTSTYVWERALEQDVKERSEAEQRRTPQYAAQPPVAARHQPSPRAETSSAQGMPADLPPGAEAPAPPTGVFRTNDQLLANVNFRSAVDDVMRLAIIRGFRELRPDTLTVDLDSGAFTSASTEYNLGRLYLAYRETTDYSGEGALELYHDGRRVGLYVPGRLTWEAVR